MPTDKYIGFTYRERRIGIEKNPDFIGFIIPDNQEFDWTISPSFYNEEVPSIMGNHSIILGATKERKIFNFEIQLIGIENLNELRDFIEWIDVDEVGFLKMDYSPFSYKVKLESIENVKSRPYEVEDAEQCNVYYDVSMTLEFTTVDDWSAYELDGEEYYKKSLQNWSSSTTEYNLFEVDGNVIFENKGKLNMFINIYLEQGWSTNGLIGGTDPKIIINGSDEIILSTNYIGDKIDIFGKNGISFIDDNLSYLEGVKKILIKPNETLSIGTYALYEDEVFIEVIPRTNF